MNRIPITILVGVTAALALACSSKPKSVAAPEVKPVAAEAPAPKPAAAPVEASKPETPVRISVDELNRRGYLKDAFFDLDRYEIRQDQREALQKDAEWLKKNPTVKFTLEGHCDERGTDQYNMALGEQRAQAVKDYLVQLGVDPSRIQIVSYGKERPFVIGHDERAWAQNRRDHFLVTAS